MNVKRKFFPFIADPALWKRFVDNSTNPTGPLSARLLHDEWHVDEFRGDKAMALIAIDVFNKYSIPHSWCNSLVLSLLSNNYQKQLAMAQGLPYYIRAGPIGRKGCADSLEVTS